MRILFIIAICVTPTLAGELVEVRGKVVLADTCKIPERKAIVPDKDKDICAKDKDFFTENWVIDAKTRGIRDVVVYIVSEPTDEQATLIEKDKARAKVELVFDPKKIPEKLKTLPKEPVVFDIQCCRFVPHVAVARVGQTVTFQNKSDIEHGLNCSLGGGGDWVMRIRAKNNLELTKPLFSERHFNRFFCTIHPWMKAYLKVVDTPYYAVTDEKGVFAIKDIPPGKYRIVYLHHEGGYLGGPMGWFGKTIEVKAKGATILDVDWKID